MMQIASSAAGFAEKATSGGLNLFFAHFEMAKKSQTKSQGFPKGGFCEGGRSK